jgi:hypothetical protein
MSWHIAELIKNRDNFTFFLVALPRNLLTAHMTGREAQAGHISN